VGEVGEGGVEAGDEFVKFVWSAVQWWGDHDGLGGGVDAAGAEHEATVAGVVYQAVGDAQGLVGVASYAEGEHEPATADCGDDRMPVPQVLQAVVECGAAGGSAVGNVVGA
jgi:hypothetical protein